MAVDHIYYKMDENGYYNKYASFFKSDMPIPRRNERIIMGGRMHTVDYVLYDLSDYVLYDLSIDTWNRPSVVVKVVLERQDWPAEVIELK